MCLGGKFPVRGRAVAVCSITHRTTISVTAISHIIGKGPGIGPTAHGGILRMVSHLSCHPGTITHNLTDGGAAAINIVVPSIAGICFSSLTQNVSSITTVCGCGVVLTGSSNGRRGRVRVLGALLTGRISNVVFVNGGLASRLHARFTHSGAPVILTNSISPGRRIRDIRVSCITTIRRTIGSLMGRNGGQVTFVSNPLSRPVGNRCHLGKCGGILGSGNVRFSRRLIFRASDDCHSNRIL